MLHVWNIYLHLAHKLPYMEHLGYVGYKLNTVRGMIFRVLLDGCQDINIQWMGFPGNILTGNLRFPHEDHGVFRVSGVGWGMIIGKP